MRKPSRASCKIRSVLVCPTCEIGELEVLETVVARCSRCGYHVVGDALEALRRIVSLPDAIGRHARECGHPEMRLLPDGVYRCPACGDEVLPVSWNETPASREGRSAG